MWYKRDSEAAGVSVPPPELPLARRDQKNRTSTRPELSFYLCFFVFSLATAGGMHDAPPYGTGHTGFLGACGADLVDVEEAHLVRNRLQKTSFIWRCKEAMSGANQGRGIRAFE